MGQVFIVKDSAAAEQVTSWRTITTSPFSVSRVGKYHHDIVGVTIDTDVYDKVRVYANMEDVYNNVVQSVVVRAELKAGLEDTSYEPVVESIIGIHGLEINVVNADIFTERVNAKVQEVLEVAIDDNDTRGIVLDKVAIHLGLLASANFNVVDVNLL